MTIRHHRLRWTSTRYPLSGQATGEQGGSPISCNAWERGEIKLPTAAVADVKKAVRDAAIAYRTLVQTLCRKWWAEHRTSSRKKYLETLDYQPFGAWMDRNAGRQHASEPLYDDVLYVLQGIVSEWAGGKTVERNPRQVQEKDLDRQLGPKPTNRTDRYNVDGGSIFFKGRSVHWSAEDSHGCDRPKEHPIARALFAALNKVTWTRGSGGKILGNNEYSEEAGRYSEGAGGSYTVMEFSAKAAAERARLNRTYGRPLTGARW